MKDMDKERSETNHPEIFAVLCPLPHGIKPGSVYWGETAGPKSSTNAAPYSPRRFPLQRGIRCPVPGARCPVPAASG
ncbi:hypothetical protein RRG08_054517 [Elysia crispata]|uniref:Uncharacterized protein n=1 Tax=Elysia crispata TaxID=231223 RepID=A0AAE0XYH9_9GAST|nr:hypothetical protein RRG08_054517 [Elysia crispata]